MPPNDDAVLARAGVTHQAPAVRTAFARRAAAGTAALTLVLPWVASGCFSSHERTAGATADSGTPRDAARPIDAPLPPRPDARPTLDGGPSECSVDPGVIVGLACPESVPRGTPITVDVRVHMLGCCAVSGPLGTTARSIAPDTWEIEAPYSVCRCCDMCMCEEIVSTRSVTIEPPTGPVARIVARDVSCEVRVLDDACRTLRSDEWMAPAHVLVGETIPVRVFHFGGVSCGCAPRAELATPTGPELSFLACGCSDEDPCVDGGYEATAIAEGPGFETQVQFFHPYPGGRVAVDVHRRGACGADASIVVDDLQVVAPVPSLIADDPRATWIQVRAHQDRCCGDPGLHVTHTPSPGGTDLAITLGDCTPDPCDCSSPHRVDALSYHFLGSLPPGRTRVTAGGRTIAIDVP